jgi:predicted metalloprotease with PDZ domain
MINRFTKNCIFIFVLLWVSTGKSQNLNYSISFDTELYKQYHVKITVTENTKNRLVFSIPIWMPGSYLVKNYGENILNVKAQNGQDSSLQIIKLSKNDWEVITKESERIEFSYSVTPKGHDFLGTHIDSAGALVQGASTWMYVRGFENAPANVLVQKPVEWDISFALENPENDNRYYAANYHQLADSPIMLGTLRDTTFSLANKQYHMYFRGKADFDLNKFTNIVQRIVKYQTSLMEDIPYNRYVFQYSIMPDYKGGGGLEHANSTSIGLSSTSFMNDVRSAANITAHEFFHLWNVKRLTNDQLVSLRYDRESRTTSLWWLEGVTSYYAALTLVRTGIWSTDEFLDHFVNQIRILQQNPSRLKTSVAQASWDIWENGYYSSHISYYNKGQLVGFLLDVMIRQVTANNKSLDDVLRFLYNSYALQNKGFKDGEIQNVVEKITDKDFSAFFDRYVTGLLELPYKEILKLAGFDVALNYKDQPSIGRIRFLGKNNRIYSIDTNSTASKTGLRKNDEIISLNSNSFSNREEFYDLIKKETIGDTLAIRIRRDGVYLLYKVPVESDQVIHCSISSIREMDPLQQKIKTGILNSN